MKKAPMWQYHKELCPEGKIFHDQKELDALGEAWVDSPAMFEKQAPHFGETLGAEDLAAALNAPTGLAPEIAAKLDDEAPKPKRKGRK